MKDGFTRKKVESLTLGEKLQKLRSDMRMSLAEISKATRIQVKYLEYLENGQYDKLPADVYVRGFLRSYARYLNIDEQALVKIYERERNIHSNLGRDVVKETFQSKKFSVSSFVITPRSVALALVFLVVSGVFFYLYTEFRSFAGVPRLVILEPTDGTILEKNDVVVRGKTDTGARVSINNQPVFVGSNGEFSDTLILQPGLNTVRVVAINRFDKEKSETLSIEARYTPAAPEGNTEAAPGEQFSLDVTTRNAPIKVTLEADGTVVFSGLLAPKETRSVTAKQHIKVTSDNAKDTLIRMGSGEEVTLGNDSDATQSAVFTAAGRQE